MGVVALGLLGVLFVNAILSQGAFRQHELEIELTLISEQEEALARKVQVDESPLTLERRAIALGMVPAESPVFLDLEKQKILGEPVPAPSPTVAVTIGPDELTAPPERLAGTLLVPEAPSPAPSPAPVGSAAASQLPASASAAPPGSGSPAPSPAAPSTPSASPGTAVIQ